MIGPLLDPSSYPVVNIEPLYRSRLRDQFLNMHKY
jgi:hypothetical protein